MPQAQEIFAQMPQIRALEILALLHEKEKPLYRATVAALTKQCNFRPVFIERKPRQEQFAWILPQISRKSNAPLAVQLLQVWLVGHHKQMLCDFLDGFGIAHDENGTVETLPSSPAKEEIVRVVETLLSKYDPINVSIYLHAFQTIDDSGWPALGEILAEDSRLQLSQSPAS
jgi:hypothetical protein